MGSCGDSPACGQPLDPRYLPAAPIDAIPAPPPSGSAWYKVDRTALRDSFALLASCPELLDSVPPLLSNNEVLIFAEKLLFRASPRWMTGCRKIARSTDERTLLCGVFPFSAAGDSLQVWTADSERAVLLPALLSSLLCDFAARFKVGGTNLNFFIAEQLPVLSPEVFDGSVPWDTGEPVRDWLLPRVIELTYSDWALQPFAADCRWDGQPSRWDDDRRYLLRCELDAAIFHLCLPAEKDGAWRPAFRFDGCARDETPDQLVALQGRFSTPRDAVAYIMHTFPIVHRKDYTQYREYRTKRTVIEIYDRMQKSVASGQSYRTRPDPLPAKVGCCHPLRDHAL